ncbi:LysR family transcriptional regulator [Roseovarius gahaiensis]|uniref:LysR family transcriptional regulator n=1 Tax=Roseovarius gahaiensis TaxID=2716691 RepID=A0A967EG40_9RHOB|nr:LysR family transcriptional regulator [Roseovarius gahaiensis]NHQ76068.1 LysR family transcriptional regulator [Roseovarius gahaiensis]
MRDIRHVKIVKALDAHRNFARASEALCMSQSALSRALLRIEDTLGVELFERTRTSVVPTVYAEIILQRSDNLISAFDDMLQSIEAKRHQDERGVRISVGPYAAEAIGLLGFSTHASSDRTFNGKLFIRDWRTCLEDLIEKRSDLAITDTRSAQEYPELASEVLGGGSALFFCGSQHPLAKQTILSWIDLMQFPWATTLAQNRWLDLLPGNLGAAGRVDPVTGDFVPAICVDNFSAMVAAVKEGRAISVAPAAFIADELKRGDLVTLPISEPWLTMEYGLIWRRNQTWSPNLRRFVKTLKDIQQASSYDSFSI